MSMNFPSPAVPGQVYTPLSGYSYVFLDGVWRIVQDAQSILTADTRNRIVNGAMQISQENADAIGTTSGYWPADQWTGPFSGTGFAWQFKRARGPTPNGSDNTIMWKCTTAKASLAATDFVALVQHIEGSRVADFRWGFADAKSVVLRFCVYSATAGTFNVYIGNAGFTRYFVKSYIIAADEVNTYKYITVALPGDTTGTWASDNTKGMEVVFPIAVGTNYQGAVEGSWQSGNKYMVAGSVNYGVATLNTQQWFSDVGLYLDPLATGVPPRWQMPDEAEELRACQRYWQKYTSPLISAYGAAASAWYASFLHPTLMRVGPSVSLGAVTYVNSSAASAFSAQPDYTTFQFTVTAIGHARIGMTPLTMNARM